MRSDFAAFILTHGRPDHIYTLRTLERAGYTGRIYLIIDDEDATGDQYRERYGDQVITFSKDVVGATFDQYDNLTDRRSIVWARNACWDIAKQVGVRYFIQLDDDYNALSYRLPGRKHADAQGYSYRRSPRKTDADGVGYHGWKIANLDAVLEAMVTFVATTPTATLCMSQGGDHMGGADSPNAKAVRLRRKAMNSFVCDADKPFTFRGRINEDVNTYVTLGALGYLFFTYTPLQLDQWATQSNPGGMTDLYLGSGTYVKSMYPVIAAPSCVTVSTMGRYAQRLHHRIDWRHAVPKILAA